MAKVTLEGYVDDIIRSKAGEVFALKVSEPHYRKDGDEFVADGRTFFKVMKGWDSNVELADFNQGDKVEVSGKQKTEVREYEGKKYYDLVVKADTVTLVRKGEARGAGVVSDVLGGTPVDLNAPF